MAMGKCSALTWLLLLVVLSYAQASPHCSCGRVKLRASESLASVNQVRPLDLSQLSDEQMLQLLQQLAKLRQQQQPLLEAQVDDDNMADIHTDSADTDELGTMIENDDRGSKRPWRKIERIIRRQLVRIPKRYLKKLIRQWGLARSVDAVPSRNADLYYLYDI